MEMRPLLGVVGQRTVGRCDEVDMICTCGADTDAGPTPDCREGAAPGCSYIGAADVPVGIADSVEHVA